MELPWQTNWTHMMKTNATANRLLNTRIGDSTFWVVPQVDRVRSFTEVTLAELTGFDEKLSPQYKDAETRRWYDKKSAREAMGAIDKAGFKSFNDKLDVSDVGKLVTTGFNFQDEIPARSKKVEEITNEDMDSIVNNTYVKDYLNIHHPSIRVDLTSTLTNHPLLVKPPPVFFSS